MNREIPRTGSAMNGTARPSTLRGWAGFSLIEVIVATAVSSVILLIVYSAHRSIMTSIFDLTGVAEFHENVSLAVQRMDRDISYAYAQKFNERVCFIGENQMGQTANGRLDFITTDFSRESISQSPQKAEPDQRHLRGRLPPAPGQGDFGGVPARPPPRPALRRQPARRRRRGRHARQCNGLEVRILAERTTGRTNGTPVKPKNSLRPYGRRSG